MNNYVFYIVPGVLAFFVVWVFFRFIVKKDIDRDNLLFYLFLSFILLALLIYGWYYNFKSTIS